MRQLALILLATLSLHAFADDDATPDDTAETSDRVTADYRKMPFTVKLGAIGYSYEEMGIMHVDGNLYTLGGEYRRSFGLERRIPMYFDVDLNIAYGLDEYHGAVNHPDHTTSPTETASRDQIYNLEGHFGMSFFDTSTQTLDVYAGLGVWYLENKINGAGSYTRDITYFYLPIGVRYTVRAGPSFKFTSGLQYNQLMFGTVVSRFSEVDSNADDSSNLQTEGGGFTVNAIGEFTFEHTSLFAEAYYRYWEIQSSNGWVGDGGIWYEPHNKTKLGGLSVGMRF